MRCLSLIVIVFISSCNSDNTAEEFDTYPRDHVEIICDQPYQYQTPEYIQDGLNVADLRTQAIDVSKLIEMAEKMHCGEFNHQINSVLISLNGNLIHEAYFPGFKTASDRTIIDYDKYTTHALASSTKSITSTLIGIAIDLGYIESTETKLQNFYSDYPQINWEKEFTINNESVSKAEISLHDVLSMSAGLKWDEGTHSYLNSLNDAYKLKESDDWYKFVLERPLISKPGELYVYNSGLSILLGGIVDHATNLSADEFAEEYLFKPLNIDNYWWGKGPNNEIQTGGGLWLTPRAMQKIGQLFLDEGAWDERQIISKHWIEVATKKRFDLNYEHSKINGYGYQWWMSTFDVNGKYVDTFASLGFGGQQIYIFKDLDLVVTFTAHEYPREHGNVRTREVWLQDYILPAIVK